MEKYRIKENEAIALSDFLLPMLEYFPERRATAQKMLSHYWLNMPANFEYHMSEREYERLNMIKKNQKKEKLENNPGDTVESENDLNMADDEDNDDYSSQSDESEYLEDGEIINIQNFNNSFAAYGQHVNLAALDRANPQFEKNRKVQYYL